MATAVMEDKQVQYQAILEGDVIEVTKAIRIAKQAADDANTTYEQTLLSTPVIWGSKMTDSKIAESSGVSKAMVAIYRRTGRIISFAPSAGVKPSQIATLVNTLHNAAGSSGKNIDPVLEKYQTETDNPTWAGAVAALKRANKAETTPKTDAQKADGYIKSLLALKSKGYVLSTEQIAALDTLK